MTIAFKGASEPHIEAAWDSLRCASSTARLRSVYEPSIAAAFCELPGFEYPDWDHRTVGEVRRALAAALASSSTAAIEAPTAEVAPVIAPRTVMDALVDVLLLAAPETPAPAPTKPKIVRLGKLAKKPAPKKAPAKKTPAKKAPAKKGGAK